MCDPITVNGALCGKINFILCLSLQAKETVNTLTTEKDFNRV